MILYFITVCLPLKYLSIKKSIKLSLFYFHNLINSLHFFFLRKLSSSYLNLASRYIESYEFTMKLPSTMNNLTRWQIDRWTLIIEVPFWESDLQVISRRNKLRRPRLQQYEKSRPARTSVIWKSLLRRGSFQPARCTTVVKRRHVGHIHRCVVAAAVTGNSWICAFANN